MSSNQKPTLEDLRKQNKLLQSQIAQATQQQSTLTKKLANDINTFQQNSKNKLNQMSEQILSESKQSHSILEDLTNKYQGVLKEQIKLLTENQKLNQLKEEQENTFKDKIDEISKQYQKRINDVEKGLREKTKRVANLQGSGLIRILLKNDRFREEIKNKGGNIQNITLKIQQQELYSRIKDKEDQIKQLQASNEKIDEQVNKLSDMMLKFNDLLERMKLQRAKLQEENKNLNEKLKDSKMMLMQITGRIPIQ